MRIRPKKRLGQNFLVDANIRNKIVDNIDLNAESIVLEIGAGKGELTRLLAKKAKHVYALEIDKRLCLLLRETLKDFPNVTLINEDVLEFDISKLARSVDARFTVVGNIPYYISSPIIEWLINNRQSVSQAFLTVQKEFAQRVVAKPGSKIYGSFSCFVQYYMHSTICFDIKKGSFHPVPKVDSSFLQLEVRIEPPVRVEDESVLFKVIRAAFNKRRKTLRNSLFGIIAAKDLESFLADSGLNSNIRPEDLNLQDFANLAHFCK